MTCKIFISKADQMRECEGSTNVLVVSVGCCGQGQLTALTGLQAQHPPWCLASAIAFNAPSCEFLAPSFLTLSTTAS